LGKASNDETIYKIMKPLVENLVVEIEKSMRFYEESINAREKIKRIIFAGGGALLKDLVKYVAERISVEVELGNPLALIDQKESCPENLQRSLAPYATAIGLAVRACNYDDQNKSSL
jgi:Tfp pilus assembly PilM family ATPase